MYGIISPHAQNVGGHNVNNMSKEVHSAQHVLGVHCAQTGVLYL